MKRFYIELNGVFIRDYKSESAAKKFYMDILAKKGCQSIIHLSDNEGNLIRSNDNC